MYDYFKAKFDSTSGELKSTELAFKAALYFSPSKLNELKPATSDTHSELVSFLGADPRVLTCKPALFISQYQLVSAKKPPRICCLLAVAHVSCTTYMYM